MLFCWKLLWTSDFEKILMWVWCVCSVSIVLLPVPSVSQQGPYQRNLLKQLLKDYNRMERPVANDSLPLTVNLTMILVQIMDVVGASVHQPTLTAARKSAWMCHGAVFLSICLLACQCIHASLCLSSPTSASQPVFPSTSSIYMSTTFVQLISVSLSVHFHLCVYLSLYTGVSVCLYLLVGHLQSRYTAEYTCPSGISISPVEVSFLYLTGWEKSSSHN